MCKINENPTISIIVPVYQVEDYLSQCLDSILSQSFSDFELILIDDGSRDRSGAICDEYAEKDNRIRVFHQRNAGQSAARNKGLDEASGEYITMIDSDDVLLTDDYLKILYAALIENDAEVSMCNAETFIDPAPVPYLDSEAVSSAEGSYTNNMIIAGRDLFARDSGFGGALFRTLVPVVKLYRRNRFEGIRFPEGRIIEDSAIAHLLLYPCERIVVVPLKLYGYRSHKNSTMKSTKGSVLFNNSRAAFDDWITYFRVIEDDAACKRSALLKSYESIRYFAKAVFDDSVCEIPMAEHPTLWDYLNHNDPPLVRSIIGQLEFPYADQMKEEYYDREGMYAVSLLEFTKSMIEKTTDPSKEILPPDNDYMGYEHMAREEKLIFAISTYNIDAGDKAFFGLEKSEFYKRLYIRRFLQYEHITNVIEKRGVDFGITVIPLLHNVLDPLYPKPWYRDHEDSYYLISPGSEDRISSLMEGTGFEEDPGSVDGRMGKVRRWTQDHGIRVSFITDLSSCVDESLQESFMELGDSLLDRGTPMTYGETDLFLTGELYSCMKGSKQLTLADLLDLQLLHKKNSEPTEQSEYMKIIDSILRK